MEPAARSGIAIFWTWFVRHESALSNDSPHDGTLDDLVLAIQRIHPDLSCEICVGAQPHELIVTAGGRRALFALVGEIVAAAPAMPAWRIVGLKPAQGFDFVTDYEGHRYDPQSMWFLPLHSRSKPGALGIRVGLPRLPAAEAQLAMSAVAIVVETALGERLSSEEIHYIEVAELPEDPEACGYSRLSDLPLLLESRQHGGRGGV